MMPTRRGSEGETRPRQKMVVLLASGRENRDAAAACRDVCVVERECVSGLARLFGYVWCVSKAGAWQETTSLRSSSWVCLAQRLEDQKFRGEGAQPGHKRARVACACSVCVGLWWGL